MYCLTRRTAPEFTIGSPVFGDLGLLVRSSVHLPASNQKKWTTASRKVSLSLFEKFTIIMSSNSEAVMNRNQLWLGRSETVEQRCLIYTNSAVLKTHWLVTDMKLPGWEWGREFLTCTKLKPCLQREDSWETVEGRLRMKMQGWMLDTGGFQSRIEEMTSKSSSDIARFQKNKK